MRAAVRRAGGPARAARRGRAALPPALRRRPTPDELEAELARAPRRPTSSAASPSTARTATSSSCCSTARRCARYGSQGQQRVALLALLFAERELLAERRGRAPLMLLDDVMSELDADRRELLGGAAARRRPGARHRHRAQPRAGRREHSPSRSRPGRIHGPERGAGGMRRLAPRSLGARPRRRARGRARRPTLLARVQALWPEVAGAALAAATAPVGGARGRGHDRLRVVALGARARASSARPRWSA